MTVRELIEATGMEALVLPDGERMIGGCYIGDLLSRVMGEAKTDDAWLTIMSNLNIVAVASLADTACIILVEGVGIDEAIREAAEKKDINILSCREPAYETAIRLSGLL